MKLLIITQIVDRTDTTLGFFHRWIEEFAKHAESVEVICLYEGAHTLPRNVYVHSLGKEKGTQSPFQYAFRFLSLVWKLRREYDAVFVHMNAEYVLLAGLLWRALRKRIALWYVHGTVSLRLHIAVLLSHVVLTASQESMRVQTRKKRVVGHGIDTEMRPNEGVRGEAVLSVGRLTKSKHHDLIIEATQQAGKTLRIAGEGSERASLEAFARSRKADVVFLGGLPPEGMSAEYERAQYFVHASTTGSMDKVVLEALLRNCPVITTSSVYEGLPVRKVDATPEAIAHALTLPPETIDRASIISKQFSLSLLIPKIMRELSV
jgi:glycosyltransferase involved in cell wall biosynthesis